MTKLKIPEGYNEPVVINLGVVYPVINGHIELPEAHVHDALFAQGFTIMSEPERPFVKPARSTITDNKAE